MVFATTFSSKERQMAGAMVRHCIRLLDETEKPVNQLSESEKEDLIATLVDFTEKALVKYD